MKKETKKRCNPASWFLFLLMPILKYSFRQISAKYTSL